jgi:cell division protein FtsW (lipid II flippase)
MNAAPYSGFAPRRTEALLLAAAAWAAVLGFELTALGSALHQNLPLLGSAVPALVFSLVFALFFGGLHVLLRWRRTETEQVLLPIVALLAAIGLVMIWRLRGEAGVSQQLVRGLAPGAGLMALFIVRPKAVEGIRRWAYPLSAIGLGLSLATGLFGMVDETGARLALKLGPLPAFQTSEILKVALIVFLASFIAQEGEKAEGTARPLAGWLRLPAVRYFVPGLLFVAMGTLALVQMSDFGAVVILGVIYIGMLYAGFETRTFATVTAIGLGLAVIVGLGLWLVWDVPTVIEIRFIAFLDPWSQAELVVDGVPAGITIAQGPGYQVQQAIYAIIAGGLSGTGLGFGTPEYVPLAHSDFIFAAVLEEMGAVVGVAVLALFAILLIRLLRLAARLTRAQTFERLLLTGIAIHLFTQMVVMVGGTINLLPVTGITIPFLSLGGVALAINLAEVGIALALARRLEALPR